MTARRLASLKSGPPRRSCRELRFIHGGRINLCQRAWSPLAETRIDGIGVRQMKQQAAPILFIAGLSLAPEARLE